VRPTERSDSDRREQLEGKPGSVCTIRTAYVK